jgi:GntR family transcriptional regulator, transcriptional repressor for pyruvate dehydrogenase complex
VSIAFQPIPRRTLADDVRRQLEAHIRDGRLTPGAMLPPEGELAARLGVSRSSVRGALRDLLAVGLLERRGNRAHVVEQLPVVQVGAALRATRIREVFETRRLLEVQLAEYAAVRATPAQRDEVLAVAGAIAAAADVEALRPLDRAFHGAIAAAAANALLAELHAKVLDAVFASPPFDTMLRKAAGAAEEARILATSARSHGAIAAAVAAGDALAAGAAARAHLDDVEARLLAD